ncbi:glycerophosphodiester phosphodiesterase GDPDL4-like [Prosopis cineraria]|uniref:glycerophosphodiester phosphodiesterase GDPDL4-like n=1 Tax=Prosopis cineraria TaxID=364024 RepID=UPI00240FB6CA|nr:glycerophosphodiester phosphodiesterase GDPDL4-like [Prosopis cineraria]
MWETRKSQPEKVCFVCCVFTVPLSLSLSPSLSLANLTQNRRTTLFSRHLSGRARRKFSNKAAAMWSSRALSPLLTLFILHSVAALVSAQGSTRTSWKTLSGDAPLVIARGGFSGIFPDSSLAAYNLALITSVPNVISWCDVQLTKDSAGICLPDIKLDNASDISGVFQNKSTTYLVNGVPTRGYFSVDYTIKDLSQVVLSQGVYSRTNKFDGNAFPIFTVEEFVKQVAPPVLWLNIQHDIFYSKHNLSMRNFVLSVSRKVIVKYISSPEVGFLRGIAARFNPNITKLIFRFMEQDDTEPSTNQTYGTLGKNLTFIKTFASGIMVPKIYIWPVDASSYLQPQTTLVLDAHKAGLEVFASDFTNDVPISYNYSYDPLAEYLQFIDNGDFSVDGVLSDFPITPSEAVGCFAHLSANAAKTVNISVISKYGASGDYPPCTDMAYNKAISDGVDVLDCPVQLSQDGVPFCLSSIDLIESSTVAQSSFSRLATSIPEIKSGSGIFSFSLKSADISTLTPSILNPYAKYTLFRSPKSKNVGKFMKLSDFLSLAKNQTSLSGVLITVEHAAYLAEKVGLNVINAVLTALNKAGYDKSGAQKVLIQSSDSSVLKEFKGKPNYELVYNIVEKVGDAENAVVEEIKGFADSVVVAKSSVFPENSAFLIGSTKIVPKLKSSNLSVYVDHFENEFVSQAWDFFSDATVEINSFVQGAPIDGVITGFPKTANRYRRNPCLVAKTTPAYMQPVKPGDLIQLVTKEYLPPAAAPLPALTESEVSEAPFPPISNSNTTANSPAPASGTGASPPGSAQAKVNICFFLSTLAVLVSFLLLL